MKSRYYDWCLKAWKNNWTNEDDLLVWKTAGRITETEYEEITRTPR